MTRDEKIEMLKAAVRALAEIKITVDVTTGNVLFMDSDGELGFAKPYEPFVAACRGDGEIAGVAK
jgi:hypothetical protein